MTGYEWIILLLVFSIAVNVCYIGLRIYDHLAERRLQRDLNQLQRRIDQLRHPSVIHNHEFERRMMERRERDIQALRNKLNGA